LIRGPPFSTIRGFPYCLYTAKVESILDSHTRILIPCSLASGSRAMLSIVLDPKGKVIHHLKELGSAIQFVTELANLQSQFLRRGATRGSTATRLSRMYSFSIIFTCRSFVYDTYANWSNWSIRTSSLIFI